MASSEQCHISRRDFLKFAGLTVAGLALLKLRGSTVFAKVPAVFDPSPYPLGEAGAIRAGRRIQSGITDYMSDEVDMPLMDRISYLTMVKQEMGVTTLRTEFRMNKLINPDGSFNDKTRQSYKDSLVAMREVGFEPPTLVLFTPAAWMEDLARQKPEDFYTLYKKYVVEVVSICVEAGVVPKYLQVMNEVNTLLQTQLSSSQVLEMIKITDDVLKQVLPETKVMTTILADASGWEEYTKKLVADAGTSLSAIGFDHYPFWQAREWVCAESPFNTFIDTSIYEWMIQEKISGILKNKDVLLTEIGMPDVGQLDSDFQRFGLNRMMMALDHLLLKYQRLGYNAEDLISAVWIFQGGDFPSIVAKFPLRVDVTPWTLIRRDKEGQWEPTAAGKRLKYLIETRMHPPADHEDSPLSSLLFSFLRWATTPQVAVES